MTSRLLASFGEVWQGMKDFFSQNIGDAGLTIIICVLTVVGLLLLWGFIQPAIGKTKFVIKWWRLIFLIVDVVLLVYFCCMYQ